MRLAGQRGRGSIVGVWWLVEAKLTKIISCRPTSSGTPDATGLTLYSFRCSNIGGPQNIGGGCDPHSIHLVRPLT